MHATIPKDGSFALMSAANKKLSDGFVEITGIIIGRNFLYKDGLIASSSKGL